MEIGEIRKMARRRRAKISSPYLQSSPIPLALPPLLRVLCVLRGEIGAEQSKGDMEMSGDRGDERMRAPQARQEIHPLISNHPHIPL